MKIVGPDDGVREVIEEVTYMLYDMDKTDCERKLKWYYASLTKWQYMDRLGRWQSFNKKITHVCLSFPSPTYGYMLPELGTRVS